MWEYSWIRFWKIRHVVLKYGTNDSNILVFESIHSICHPTLFQMPPEQATSIREEWLTRVSHRFERCTVIKRTLACVFSYCKQIPRAIQHAYTHACDCTTYYMYNWSESFRLLVVFVRIYLYLCGKTCPWQWWNRNYWQSEIVMNVLIRGRRWFLLILNILHMRNRKVCIILVFISLIEMI